MTTINQLSSLDTLSGGDQLPVFSTGNGDARKSSISLLLSYIAANLGSASGTSITLSSFIKTTPVPVASLPTGTAGTRACVTNATQTLTAGIGAVVVGGGSNTVPVFHDGTNWRIG